MHRRAFLASVFGGLALCRAGAVPAAAPTARIGFLTPQRPEALAPFLDAFRAGLAELGRHEGQNLAIEYRYADNDVERIPELARELARLPVDLIVAQGVAGMVFKLNLPVPVVYTQSGDPVSAGLADSLSQPRGNMTGVTFMLAELIGKRLQLAKEIIPDLHRVAMIGSPYHAGVQLEHADAESSARRLGLVVENVQPRSKDELPSMLAAMAAHSPQVILLLTDAFTLQNRKAILDFAMERRIPVISGWPIFAQTGALLTFGPQLTDSYRRLAYYVDRVLKGARPSDLPIEQPTTFEMVINLQTARTLGLTISPALLARADRVIE